MTVNEKCLVGIARSTNNDNVRFWLSFLHNGLDIYGIVYDDERYS
jgi:hypothetical protein